MVFRRRLLQLSSYSAPHGAAGLFMSSFHHHQSHFSTKIVTADDKTHVNNDSNSNDNERRGKWFTLPPFTSTINGSALGKELAGGSRSARTETPALKWVLRCCPDLPRSLIQKLFRLRQVQQFEDLNFRKILMK